ncbi:MAG: YbaB/EbfC family nucleoid-associated protein [Chlorobiaceae bacterium]
MAMPNFGDMMKQIQQAGEKMQDVHKQLEKIVAYGEAGGGMVKVSVSGKQKVLTLVIDPDIFDDPEMVQDLVLAAVNNAIDESLRLAQDEITKVTGGMVNPADILKNLDFGK